MKNIGFRSRLAKTLLAASLIGAPLLSVPFSVTPLVGHASAATGYGSTYVSELTGVYQTLTADEKTTIRNVRDDVSTKSWAWWSGIIDNGDFNTKIHGLVDEETEITPTLRDLVNIFYSVDNVQSSVEAFKTNHAATFHQLFGDDTTGDDLIRFVDTVQGIVQDQMQSYMFDLILGIKSPDKIINDAIEQALTSNDKLSGKLSKIGLKVGDVVNIRTKLTSALDSDKIGNKTGQATAARDLVVQGFIRKHVSLKADGSAVVNNLISGNANTTKKLSLNVEYPANQFHSLLDFVDWKTSNDGVASVDSENNLLLVGTGTATITATDKVKGLTLANVQVQVGSTSVQHGVRALSSVTSNTSGDYLIDSTDFTSSSPLTVGPESGQHTHDGNITLDPGADKSVILRNIHISGNTNVRSGASHTITLDNVQTSGLSVNTGNQATPVRVLAQGDTHITTTTIDSQAIIQGDSSSSASLGNILITPAAANQTIQLAGNINTPVIVQQGATVNLDVSEGASVSQLNIQAPVTITVAAGSTLGSLSISGQNSNVTLQGNGTVQEVAVDSSAAGSTINVQGSTVTKLVLSGSVVLQGDASNIAIETTGSNVTVDTSGLSQQTKDALKQSAIRNAIEAINALPATITLNDETTVNAARQKVNGAKALRANDNDITNLSKLTLAEATIIGLKNPTPSPTPAPSGGGGGGGGGAAPATSATITADKGGTVYLNGAKLVIPVDALSTDFKVTVNRVNDTSLPVAENMQVLGNIFEITKNKDGNFASPVNITLPFDTSKADPKLMDLALYWFNTGTQQWVKLDNVNVDWSAGTVSGDVSHFTKFAVLATMKAVPVPTPVPGTPGTELADIQGHWAENVIKKLVASGAIHGYPDGTFKPDQEITRAEFAAVLVSALKLPGSSDKVFADTQDHWAKNSISTAVSYGIAHGYNDTTFGVNDPITREQMAAMIVNAMKLDQAAGGKVFSDTDQVSSWAKNAVDTASAKGMINGYPDGSFKPQGHATRAEASSVIVNVVK